MSLLARVPKFKRETVRGLADVDRRSMRISGHGTHRAVLACPRGAFDDDTGACGRPPVLVAILHPLSEPVPCDTCNRLRMGWRF